MSYAVKECYFTLQGEGAQTGRAAVFLRFAGCNLWSGLERDRKSAVCAFCDTDFVGTDGPGGGRFDGPQALVAHVQQVWQAATLGGGAPYVICTGGEPLLQLDETLVEALHGGGFEVGVETNGTLAAPANLDWICVSPKADAELVQLSGNELKLVYPQPLAAPARFEALAFDHFFLQPMDGTASGLVDSRTAVEETIRYCQSHPQWRLSVQTHKMIGLP